MKKKLQLGLIICLSLVLAACKSPESAKEATTVLVNGLIYDKDLAKINEMFTYNEKLTEQNKESSIVTELKALYKLDDSYDEQLEAIIDKQQKSFVDKTSFKVNVLTEAKGKAKAEISVMGLEEWNDEQLITTMEKELELKLAEVSEETTDQEIEKLVNDVSLNTLALISEERQVKHEPTVVTLDLATDSKDKSKWVIQNDETFMTNLFEAFGE